MDSQFSVADTVFGRTHQLLEKSMQLRWARQGLLAANIANAETPNYRALDIDFKATMAELVHSMEARKAEEALPFALRETDPRHLQPPETRALPTEPGHIVFSAGDTHSFGNDSNSVELEEQIARQQMNATLYTATVRLMQRKIQGFNDMLDSLGRV